MKKQMWVDCSELFDRAVDFAERRQFGRATKTVDSLHESITSFRRSHRHVLHQAEMAQLGEARKRLRQAQKAMNYKSESCIAELDAAQNQLAGVFDSTIVYLQRYPGEGEKTFTRHHAKRFADHLSKMILLCPKKVKISFHCSDIRETSEYLHEVKKHIQTVIQPYSKPVTFAKVQAAAPLHIRFTDAQAGTLDPDLPHSDILENWVDNKYPGFPRSSVVSKELDTWLRGFAESPSTRVWNLVVGVSHPLSIGGFLAHRTDSTTRIIPPGKYIRVRGREMLHDKEWYPF